MKTTRTIDPYKELKDAWEAGRRIRIYNEHGPTRWFSKDGGLKLNWNCSPSDYEIEPLPTDPLAEVKAAHARGEKIEVRSGAYPDGPWFACSAPEWLNGSEYRIAPTAPPSKLTDEQLGEIGCKRLESVLNRMTKNLHQSIEKHGFGLVGQDIDKIVCDEIDRLHAELATSKHWNAKQAEEIARLSWRPISVKPTLEDADPFGNVQVCGWREDGHCSFHGLHDIKYPFREPDTFWRPFYPPPMPTKEEVERGKFERTMQATFEGGWLHGIEKTPTGEYFVHESEVGFRIWQAARAEKEVKR